MKVQHTGYQGGSIVSFVIITVVVAALLVGGLIWLRHRGVAANEPTPTLTAQKEGAVSSNKPEKSGGTEDSKGLAEGTAGSQASSQPSADAASTKENSSSPSDMTVSALPETGAAEVLAGAVSVVVLSYTVARYVVSRRALTRA
jgi:cytoskeletal protein RodZ